VSEGSLGQLVDRLCRLLGKLLQDIELGAADSQLLLGRAAGYAKTLDDRPYRIHNLSHVGAGFAANCVSCEGFHVSHRYRRRGFN